MAELTAVPKTLNENLIREAFTEDTCILHNCTENITRKVNYEETEWSLQSVLLFFLCPQNTARE